MTKKTTKLKQLDKPSINYGKILYMVFAMTILMSVLAVNCFAAGTTDMWTKATEIMKLICRRSERIHLFLKYNQDKLQHGV